MTIYHCLKAPVWCTSRLKSFRKNLELHSPLCDRLYILSTFVLMHLIYLLSILSSAAAVTASYVDYWGNVLTQKVQLSFHEIANRAHQRFVNLGSPPSQLHEHPKLAGNSRA